MSLNTQLTGDRKLNELTHESHYKVKGQAHFSICSY